MTIQHDDFPCKEPLAAGQEMTVARLLHDAGGVVPIDVLLERVVNRDSLKVVLSKLRSKLLDGYEIVRIDDGYQLVYRAAGCSSSAKAQVHAELSGKVAALQAEVEGINEQLQVLNERKQGLKRKLEVAEVGLLALEELE